MMGSVGSYSDISMGLLEQNSDDNKTHDQNHDHELVENPINQHCAKKHQYSHRIVESIHAVFSEALQNVKFSKTCRGEATRAPSYDLYSQCPLHADQPQAETLAQCVAGVERKKNQLIFDQSSHVG
mmetsp:Transcript_11408/g.13912  ORF Transcript_11408/g.13912 Transcript_11408/m.13912 type:complete len:126 (-) Transcript_11408:794-1171(-)